jgi:hypothetical protein
VGVGAYGGWVVSEDLEEDLKSATAICSLSASRCQVCWCDGAAGGTSIVCSQRATIHAAATDRITWRGSARLDCRSTAQARGELHGLCMSA